MRLAHKLSLAQIVLIFAILTLHAGVQFRREVHLFENDMRRDQHETGAALAAAGSEVWRNGGQAAAWRLVQAAAAAESSIKIRWIAAGLPIGPEGSRAAGGSRVRQTSDSLSTIVPVVIDGTTVGAIQVAESLREERRFARATLLHVILFTSTIGLGAFLLSVLFGASIIVKPMEELVTQAQRIGKGDLTVRLSSRPRDEIGQLVEEMNVMCDRLRQARDRLSEESKARLTVLEQLRHADRLATVGTLASGLAHELGTPLNVVSGRAKMMEQSSPSESETAGNARIIREQAERMTRIIRQLLDFSRRDEPAKEHVDLRLVAALTLSLLQPMARKQAVTLELSEPESSNSGPVEAWIDLAQMKQVVTNLVLNGIQAMSSGGRLMVRVERRRAEPPADPGGEMREFACLRVEDQGSGIEAGALPRVFDPFFTTKGIGEGTGLGLSVSHGIVREHRGWIAVESTPGEGSRFEVYLPLEEEA